jgi:hypothetical protein
MTEDTPEKQPWAHQVADEIEKLVNTASITWGNAGNWRYPHVVVLADFTLSLTGQDPMVIKQGSTAYFPEDPGEIASEYRVKDTMEGQHEAMVPASSVKVKRVGDTVPDHKTGPIQLMCYEFFPYAAMCAGLISPADFFEGLSGEPRRRYEDGSTSWAAFFGLDPSQAPKLELAALSDHQFGRGDVIVLYTKGTGVHTVIASGLADPKAGPLLYSLWHTPGNHPGCWPIAEITAGAAKDDPIVSFRAVTPRKPAAQQL